MAGIDTTGFVSKTLEDIKSELEASMKAALGADLDVSAASVAGQLIGIMADREADVWELMADVYASQYPDTASGTSLVDVCAITGTVPDPPTHSTVTVTASGTPGTVISAGRIFQVTNSGARFVTIDAATIGGGGTVDIACQSEDTGPKIANSGTLTVIITAVSGLTSVTNALDAEPGTALETDAQLRVRRETELRLAGKGTVEAIRTDVLAVDGVDACIVFQNTTEDNPDANGLPPHSVEVVVQGSPDEDALRAAIFASAAAGIQLFGDETGTVIDSQGFTQEVDFSYATEKDAWIKVTYTKNGTAGMSDSDIQARVKTVFVAWADANYDLGDDLVTSKLDFPLWDDTALASQAYDITFTTVLTNVGDPTPGGGAYNATNKTTTVRQFLAFDSSRITVIVS